MGGEKSKTATTTAWDQGKCNPRWDEVVNRMIICRNWLLEGRQKIMASPSPPNFLKGVRLQYGMDACEIKQTSQQ
jgi:hypothetical protein